MRQMTSELDRMFDEPTWPSFRTRPIQEAAAWYPEIDVFEKDNRLVTKIDLPGMKEAHVKIRDIMLVLAAGADRPVRNEEIVDTLKAICAHAAVPAAVAA